MAANLYFVGFRIDIYAAGDYAWWFHHPAWQPGNWIRASFIGNHSTFAEGCGFYDSRVQILGEWTQTKTQEDCEPLRPEKIEVYHHVHVRVTGNLPFILQPRFLVIT